MRKALRLDWIPSGYMVGYVPKGAIIGGAVKCQKKGHRPPSKSGTCTRCGERIDM